MLFCFVLCIALLNLKKMTNKVVYINSKNLIKECNRIPILKNRASIVDSLIKSYDLHNFMLIKESKICSDDDLNLFHSKTYLDYIKSRNDTNEFILDESVQDEDLEYGMGYDCPMIERMYDFVRTVAGGTLQAAEEILNGSQYAINWNGGWHHAQRDTAEGFCYVNDIAIGIQKLRSKFKRIFYIDLDAHHGDGVENAFSCTKRVFTISFHQYECGFYPGTGDSSDCGFGPGKGYSANIPYKSYIKGSIFVKYFTIITNYIYDLYKPDVCIVQCGADAITGDPLGNSNLIPQDLGKCILEILKWNLPTIFLGGGGYNFFNTAKYWTYLTSIILNKEISNDIPEHDFFLKYGPNYELTVDLKTIQDFNTEQDFEKIFEIVKGNLDKFKVSNI